MSTHYIFHQFLFRCNQATDHAESLIDESGTMVNDLVLSSSSEYHPTNPTNELFSRTKWVPFAAGMREALTTSTNPLAPGTLFTKVLDANPEVVDPQHVYCHRSIGTQTLPDNEFPSHIYYAISPSVGSHIVEPSDLKVIAPEDLPSRGLF